MFKTIFARGVWGFIFISSLLFYLLVVNTCLYSQDRPQWDDIPAGPHDIGFKVINTYDYSRGYFPTTDYSGTPSDYETSRPMQISIWYPAETDEENRQMVFGDYIELLASELGKDRVTDAARQEAKEQLRRGPLNPYYPDGVSNSDLERILNTPVPVIKDAKPHTGTFPMVIHAGFGLVGQSVLNEYLASNGYVVVSFPVLSTHPAWYNRGEGTMEWYQAIADDIGFVYGEMKNSPLANRSKTAVIGMFAASGLLYQMQNMQLQAIASLDGQYPDIIRKAPGFNLDKIRVPILDMPSINNLDKRAMLDSMRFAQRYKVHFDSVQHGEFYQFRRIAHPDQSDDDIPYKVIARYTKAFLNGTLKNDKEALHFLEQDPETVGAPSGFMKTGVVPAIGSPPTENEFLWMIREGKITEARQLFQEVSKQLPDYQICSESSLRTIAFFYRRDHGAEASVEIFELWSDIFPDSWRAKNQLGNTYSQIGDNQAAMESYTEALKLISQDQEISEEEKTDYEKQLNDLIKKLKES